MMERHLCYTSSHSQENVKMHQKQNPCEFAPPSYMVFEKLNKLSKPHL